MGGRRVWGRSAECYSLEGQWGCVSASGPSQGVSQPLRGSAAALPVRARPGGPGRPHNMGHEAETIRRCVGQFPFQSHRFMEQGFCVVRARSLAVIFTNDTVTYEEEMNLPSFRALKKKKKGETGGGGDGP